MLKGSSRKPTDMNRSPEDIHSPVMVRGEDWCQNRTMSTTAAVSDTPMAAMDRTALNRGRRRKKIRRAPKEAKGGATVKITVQNVAVCKPESIIFSV
jgi:hypothetical protein